MHQPSRFATRNTFRESAHYRGKWAGQLRTPAPRPCRYGIDPVRARGHLSLRRGLRARPIRRNRPDIIVNAAAYTPIYRAESEPEAAGRINADGARNLVRAARELGARLIQISTDFDSTSQRCDHAISMQAGSSATYW
jgi:nucleoside-diphosphate-sugar epimerase